MAKVVKYDKKKQPAKKPKAKGLAVLSEVALTEAEQLKLATKRSKTQFHSSHTSGSGDRVDTQSKIPDEQHLKTTGADEGTGTIPETEHKEEDVDERVHAPSDYELTDDEKIYNEENINEKEENEVTKELYDDVNSGFEQEEDAHVTLTLVLDTQKTGGPTQSSYVSSDFTGKLLNIDNPSLTNNEIASLMDTTTHHATIIPEITSTIKKAIQAHSFNYREEAQAEKKEYIKIVDSIVRTIIKEEVNDQVPQILPKSILDVVTLVIEKNIIESLEAVVLTRSLSQPQTSYEAAATLFEFELMKILIDKIEKNKSFDISDYKR
uniref:Uncharacterized protein n=1 Tax=Tanacetum cinerariifolium TaxID=118510 RepID=A0A6L2L367_TANCI|nr:hypothetical protein [Tanacetum cinerariifolium]